jgi:hypothetical protein
MRMRGLRAKGDSLPRLRPARFEYVWGGTSRLALDMELDLGAALRKWISSNCIVPSIFWRVQSFDFHHLAFKSRCSDGTVLNVARCDLNACLVYV